jgi:hypothetical protein
LGDGAVAGLDLGASAQADSQQAVKSGTLATAVGV